MAYEIPPLPSKIRNNAYRAQVWLAAHWCMAMLGSVEGSVPRSLDRHLLDAQEALALLSNGMEEDPS